MKILHEILNEVLAEASLDEAGRCWDGYEPVPGKKAYEPGSCRKISETANSALPIVRKSL